MNANTRSQVVIAILVVAAVLGLRGVLTSGHAVAGLFQPASAPAGLGGEYSGRIDLTDVLAGLYTDALATVTPAPSPTRPPGTLTPAPPLPQYGGKIELGLDLVLFLDTAGCQPPANVCGHVVLENSLAYPQVAVIQATPVGPTPRPGEPPPNPQALAIGPHVSGTFDGTTLRLESEVFTQVQAEARIIPTPPVGPSAAAYRAPEQKVERRFQLTGSVQDGGKTLSGEYRETMTRIVEGLRGRPVTAIGRVTLSRPVFGVTPAPSATPQPGATPSPTGPCDRHRVYLPVVQRPAR